MRQAHRHGGSVPDAAAETVLTADKKLAALIQQRDESFDPPVGDRRPDGQAEALSGEPESPIYAELCAIASKTFGVAQA